MKWNWELDDWPNFSAPKADISSQERQFLENAGVIIGTAKHLSPGDQETITVSLMSMEALDTSSIEGETLDRESVQSSIQRALGLKASKSSHRPAEAGIAEMMVDLFRSIEAPLTDQKLFHWHETMFQGRSDIALGRYRKSQEPMQIISGPSYAPKVHFEAPPSTAVPREMKTFLKWFNETCPDGPNSLPTIKRAALAHLWFESIHPFEDGNGRLGRAISEKALAQGRTEPVVTSLAGTLLEHQKDYYRELQLTNHDLDVSRWVAWFADRVLEAQQTSLQHIEFLVSKTKLLDRLRGQLNPRQEKVLLRMFAEGPSGFKGGLSAKNYITITGTTTATTTRDLSDLVQKGALRREGERKATRYYLNLDQ
ncbi:Fic family protein [Parvularcula maris]|uniref:DUF4172 domain-containing protein n=1 Tax=Parvularcula maris TaxID=2965077 RepID=A0A9X2LC39_9PROT|nr:DUF4172 domain-containing protein [Parvularcula maris]MCQ8185812.1 DUF4172 domain-containing protein [Parvularcula maris]